MLRRLLQFVPTFFGTTLLIYWMTWAMPGDPFAGKCGERACEPRYVQEMTARYHLDEPLPVQYAYYVGNLVRGDFGETYAGRQVADVIAAAAPATAKLALVAIAMEIVFGIAAGVLTGLRRNGFLDNLVLVSTLVMISVPIFVSGYALQHLLGVEWRLIDPTVSDGAPPHQLLVPGFILASLSMAAVSRLTRGSIAENSRADYVRTAVAKGLPRRRVVGVHLLRNSLLPVVTLVGLDLGGLLTGSVIIEGIFRINGLGNELYRAVTSKEGATVVGLVVVLMLAYLLITLAVDLLYAALDPRIRL